jgi:hypothetical protein
LTLPRPGLVLNLIFWAALTANRYSPALARPRPRINAPSGTKSRSGVAHVRDSSRKKSLKLLGVRAANKRRNLALSPGYINDRVAFLYLT